MSYEKVQLKINELEQLNYLDKGDHSVEYLTSSTNFISRFFNDNLSDEALVHLKNKLRQFLIEEQVLFNLAYSLLVVPCDKLRDIINNATSYSTMGIELEKLPFVFVKDCSASSIKIQFRADDNIYHNLLITAKELDYIVGEGITVYDEGKSIVIHSDNCATDNEIRLIDDLFN